MMGTFGPPPPPTTTKVWKISRLWEAISLLVLNKSPSNLAFSSGVDRFPLTCPCQRLKKKKKKKKTWEGLKFLRNLHSQIFTSITVNMMVIQTNLYLVMRWNIQSNVKIAKSVQKGWLSCLREQLFGRIFYQKFTLDECSGL